MALIKWKTFLVALILIPLFLSASLRPAGYAVGDAIRDFKLKDVSGKMVSLRDFKSAKGFIVIFTSNHCAYSMIYQQRIIDLNKQYAAEGYQLVAINSDDAGIYYPKPMVQYANGAVSGLSFDSAQGGLLDSYDNIVKTAGENHYPFPYLFDETQSVAKEFGATHTPQAFVLQKEGKELKVRYMGAIDDNAENSAAVQHRYVNDVVNALLAGKPVLLAETKAIGCTIVWKK